MSRVDRQTTHVVVATRDGVKILPAKGRAAHVRVLEEPDDLLREQATGFTNFIKEYAVVGLAIGFILGQEANAVVKQFVTSFIQPWLQVVFGTNLSNRAAIAHHGTEKVPVPWGAFVYIFIEFIFVAITIYAVVKLLRLDKLKKPKDKK